jgi:hypothetical protein
MEQLVGFLVSLVNGGWGVTVQRLVIGWLVLAVAYTAWLMWPTVRPLAHAIARRVDRRMTRAVHRRRGLPDGAPPLAVCGRCSSVFRVGLGSCYACGAPAAEATPIPEA